MAWSEKQQIAIAISPKISAVMSIFGSGFIIQEVLRSRKKRVKAHHQVLCAMSMVDICASSFLFLSSWPIPEERANVFANEGSTQFCTTQGFFLQLGIMTPMYNAALALYYLLVVRYGWHDAHIKEVERICHAIILSYGFGTGITGLALNLFNPAGAWCWIAPLPGNCQESFRGEPDPGRECIRGDNASIYRWAFWYAIVWGSGFFITAVMILVYASVRSQEKKMTRYADSGKASRSDKKHSRKVANQGMFYVGAFYVTWAFPTIARVVQLFNDNKAPFWLIYLLAISVPIQGFLNFLVYLRPRWLRYKESSGRKSFLHFSKKLFVPKTAGVSSTTELRTEDESDAHRSKASTKLNSSFHMVPLSPGIQGDEEAHYGGDDDSGHSSGHSPQARSQGEPAFAPVQMEKELEEHDSDDETDGQSDVTGQYDAEKDEFHI